jgi:indole-3-glycerol phosphate synthase
MEVVLHKILKSILDDTASGVAVRKNSISIAELSSRELFIRSSLSLLHLLDTAEAPAIIAEFKRKSPSRGDFIGAADFKATVMGYEKVGAVGISILTNKEFFGGSLEDLAQARELVSCPILRKDFIIDSYQLYEAKAYGADVVLLIARCLSRSELIELIEQAHAIGLETLLEVHDEEDIEKCAGMTPHLWGVNNRNLDTLEIDTSTTARLITSLPDKARVIAESGLKTASDLVAGHQAGACGYLIGDHFLSTDDPVSTLRTVITDSKQLLPLGDR